MLNEKLIAILDGSDSESNNRKKPNVTFKELVERIEVISDDDKLNIPTTSKM